MIPGAIVLLCAAACIPHLRRRSAAERHLLWAAAVATAAALPILSLYLPRWQPEWIRGVMAALPAAASGGSSARAGGNADVVIRAIGIESSPWGSAPLIVIWIAGACAALVRLGGEGYALWRLARRAQAPAESRLHQLTADVARTLNVRRPIRLLQHPVGIVPLTWGLRRPRVMLPAAAIAWSDDRVRIVLGHELAHVRRGDWIVHLAAELACAVYWFNPLFWIAAHALRRESEQAADDEVLGLGVDGGDYAAHLLEIVRGAQVPPRRWSPTVAMGRPSHLWRRFAALLDQYANRRGVTRWKIAAVLALAAAVVIPLAAMNARAGIPNIEIRTADLPALTPAGGIGSGERAAPAVRNVRVVGLGKGSAGVLPPEVIQYTTPPLYSDEARRLGIEGIVTIGARINVDGTAAQPRVIRSLGFGLDQNALVALRQWRFRAGSRGGVAVAMDAEIDVEFSLRNEAVNELIANDMATRVGPGVTPPYAVRMFGLWQRKPRLQGTVVLDVVLLEDGTPRIIRVLQSLDPELDEGAIRNFEHWRFTPAMKNGRPIKVRMNAEVHFHG